jgi:hypothetical protein
LKRQEAYNLSSSAYIVEANIGFTGRRGNGSASIFRNEVYQV